MGGSGVEPLFEDKDEEQLISTRLVTFWSEKRLRWRGVRGEKEVREIEEEEVEIGEKEVRDKGIAIDGEGRDEENWDDADDLSVEKRRRQGGEVWVCEDKVWFECN